MQVKVGGKICEITKIEAATVICNPPDLTPKQQKQNTNVTVNDNENLFYDSFHQLESCVKIKNVEKFV